MAVFLPVAIRDFKFSDATLEQLADLTALNVTRDIAEFTPRGVTAATVTALEALRDAFSDTPTDIEARGLVTDASEAKETARSAALIEARRLRTAAQNVFGENTGKYNRFGFEGMDTLNDNEVPRALRRMHRVGTALQAQLAAEGIDAAFLTAFAASIETLDDALDAVDVAEEERDTLTEDRILAGNALYKEIVRLCNIGKDIYAPLSEALYNDYVIERFVGAGESLIGFAQNTVAPSGTSNAGALPEGTQKVRMRGLQNGPLEFGLSNDGTTFVGNTTTLGAPNTITYTLEEFGVSAPLIIVKNQNTTQSGEYRIEFLG